MLVKTPEGKTKDVSILKPNSNEYSVTAENYIVPKGEEGKYHAVIEIPQFSPTDGSRLSQPRLQKFGEKWFDSMGGRSDLAKQGYKIIILHDPKEWLAKNKALEQESKAKKAKAALEAKAKADQEKADQEKAERQAEINAGVKAALEAMGITGPIKAESNAKSGTLHEGVKISESKPTEKSGVKVEEKKAANDADKK